MPSCSTATARARDPGEAAERRLELDLGRVQDAGSGLCTSCTRSGSAPSGRTNISARWSTPSSREGGSAVGVKAGSAYVDVGTLNGYRAAIGLLVDRHATRARAARSAAPGAERHDCATEVRA